MRRNQRVPVKDIMKPSTKAGAMTWADLLIEASDEQVFALVIREQTHLINQLSRTPDKKCPVEFRSGYFYYSPCGNKYVFINIVGVRLFGYITTLALDIRRFSHELIKSTYEKTALVIVGDSGKVERVIRLGVQDDFYKNMYAAKFAYKYYPWTNAEYIRAYRIYNEDMDDDDLWNVMGSKVQY